jgi:CubicO group peptidase (beta-lactamase class C family)
MRRDTIVRVYSMTKIVMSVAALILIEEGRLGMLDSIKNYLPEFEHPFVFTGGTARNPRVTPAREAIKIHHLLTHTSGIAYESEGEPIDDLYDAAKLDGAGSLAEMVQRLASLPLKREPGTMFEYGYSTDVLARIIEIVSGRRLEVFLRERILEPLGMKDTDFSVPPQKKDRLARIHQHGVGGALQPLESYSGEAQEGVRNYPSGGAGLFSTLDDFARLGQMLCNSGKLDGLQILGRKTVECMVADHLLDLPVARQSFTAGYSFGLGVAVRINHGLAGTLGTVGSFGWTGMATTFCLIDPVEKLVMLAFAQHLPFDEHGLFQRFTNLVYQALS